MNTIDLFAGPGGWDVGANALDIDPLGIEIDPDACRVRVAAGHPTLAADVSKLDPLDHPCELLIASPPCPAFSMGGKGEGRRNLLQLQRVLEGFTHGRDLRQEVLEQLTEEPPDGALFGYDMVDPSAILVVEPLRWALATRPRFIALEQVPPVLPLWQSRAWHLEHEGYTCWTGILSAEQFGVAQTRKRAFLLASLDQSVHVPVPTHTLYIKGQPRQAPGLLPWVSMADALGWGMTERPYPAIASSRTSGGPDKEKVGGSAARAVLYEEQDAGRWVAYNSRDQKCGKTGRPNPMRSIDEPAPTIAAESRNDSWAFERPATTIQGDSRVWPPGHKINADDVAAGRTHYEGRAGENAIRVTEAEAAALQSFPDDYPWEVAGTRSAAFRCIGNAVPPLMARAVLEALVR